MSRPTAQCRCCGVMVYDKCALRRLCMVCHSCDRRHGDELQEHVIAVVASGQITPYHAIARMMIDDALLCRVLELHSDGQGTATAWVPHGCVPERWQVVAARAIAMGSVPDIQAVVDAVLGRHLPGQATRAKLDAIARDLREALHSIDPHIVSVEVDSKRDALDPENLIITIGGTRAEAPGTVTVTEPDVEVPADILSRPRGQA